MLKVVIDTNVFVSGLANKNSSCGRILQAWKSGEITLVISFAILDELKRVLDYPNIKGFFRKAHISDKDIKDLFIAISINAVLEQDVDGPLIIKEDPSDDSFIHCAVQGNAEYIISGDKHLLKFEEYQGIKIIKPTDFIRILKQQK